MTITGLPAYATPIEQSLRCPCGARYLVYLGGGKGHAQSRAQERANMLRAIFVDARLQPWLTCKHCGQLLDFILEGSPTVQ
jgi:hypothetical protein